MVFQVEPQKELTEEEAKKAEEIEVHYFNVFSIFNVLINPKGCPL